MFKIDVVRGKTQGKVKFVHGGLSINTTCYWDLLKKIPAGTYTGCSKTRMTTKTNSNGKPREAIYIPNVSGYSGIFIHMGSSAAWSDGCIVISEVEMLKLYQAISPDNGQNVTVRVTG